MRWREQGEVRWLEADMPGARAVFTTRVGGVSDGDFESLNIGLLTDDEPSCVYENRRRVAGAAGVGPEQVLFGRQVHAAELLRRESAPQPNPFVVPGETPPARGAEAALADARQPPEADGQVTGSRKLAPLVFVADCLPVALSGGHGVAILHCGWRGLAAGIISRGARQVGATAAAVGPGIGPCCYEVGDEVRSAFAHLGEGIAAGRMLDLPEVARRELAAAGVDRVESAGLCTHCAPELFFSHRRDAGRTGRQAGLVIRA